jgi:hypothetical protein
MTWAAPGKPWPEKEGILLLDHAGWAALARKSEDALPLLKRCLELGIDPLAAGYALHEDRPLREAMNAVEALAQAGASIDEEDYPSAPGIDSRIYRLFGGGITPLASGNAWPDRVAAAMLLGICPVFMQTAGKLDRSDLLRFLSSDAEEIKALTVRLDGLIETVLEGKIPDQVQG